MKFGISILVEFLLVVFCRAVVFVEFQVFWVALKLNSAFNQWGFFNLSRKVSRFCLCSVFAGLSQTDSCLKGFFLPSDAVCCN